MSLDGCFKIISGMVAAQSYLKSGLKYGHNNSD